MAVRAAHVFEGKYQAGSCDLGLIPDRFPSVLALPERLDFALLGRLTFFACAKKVSKETPPFIRPCALRRVRSLHRRAKGRRTSASSGRPGRLPLYATIPFALLKGIWCRLQGRAKGTKAKSRSAANWAFRQLGVGSPSGGRVEVLRRGTSRRDAARGLKVQGRTL